MTEHDVVKNPAHYPKRAGHECIDVCVPFGFHLGNAIKYIWRAGLKGGPEDAVRDLEKAKIYIQKANEYSLNEQSLLVEYALGLSLEKEVYSKIKDNILLTSKNPDLAKAFGCVVGAVIFDNNYYNSILYDANYHLDRAILDFKRKVI